jgi:glycosyltransferase involved in cell wall biosynthesis
VNPRVSVVIPTYDNDAYIRATMDSVLAQTYRDFEVIVSDHSSTDRTWELLQPYATDQRVRLFRTPPGGGAQRNWNAVSSAATGEFVKLVCGDDLLYHDTIRRQVAAFDDNDSDVVMVASPRDVVDANGRLIVRNLGLAGLRGRVQGRRAVRHSVLRGANIFGEPCCVLLRRATLVQIGGWHGDLGYMIDQATYAQALLTGDLVATDGPVAAFRVSGTQWSVQLARQQAASAAGMHRELAARQPDLLSRSDVLRGNSMAHVRALQRRFVYLYLGRRLRPDAAVSESLHTPIRRHS